MWDDPAVALVCAYLRINGYFTLTEFEVSVATKHGYRSLTDLDVIAVRLPTLAERHRRSAHERRTEGGIIVALDPALHVDESRLDVLFVEVKQGKTEFNQAMRNPLVLEAGLLRVGGSLGVPVEEAAGLLAERGEYVGGEQRVRLLAVGSYGRVGRGTTLHHRHLLAFVEHHVEQYAEALKAMEAGDPVVGFIELVRKAKNPPSG
jgi:hypothetical protein